MTTLTWDEVGTRYYEAGVDRAVLYPVDGAGIVWNGLISVSEKQAGAESSPIYFDGIKYADAAVVGDFAGTMKAYTYPDEFMEFEGVLSVGNGLFVANQQTKRFGLTYRTKIGNDEDGIDHGYKIHILYNLTAIPSQKNYQTLSKNVDPMAFEWTLSAIPAEVPGFRPTAHFIFDTRQMDQSLIDDVENALYGDGKSTPTLPSPSTLAAFIGDWVIIRITDNHDGTWTAEGPDTLITSISATQFQINQANAKYTDANTYILSDLTY